MDRSSSGRLALLKQRRLATLRFRDFSNGKYPRLEIKKLLGSPANIPWKPNGISQRERYDFLRAIYFPPLDNFAGNRTEGSDRKEEGEGWEEERIELCRISVSASFMPPRRV